MLLWFYFFLALEFELSPDFFFFGFEEELLSVAADAVLLLLDLLPEAAMLSTRLPLEGAALLPGLFELTMAEDDEEEEDEEPENGSGDFFFFFDFDFELPEFWLAYGFELAEEEFIEEAAMLLDGAAFETLGPCFTWDETMLLAREEKLL